MISAQHGGIGMTSQRTRERLVQELRRQGVHDPSVLEVMRGTPRHLFVDEALASRAYEDTALPIGRGQTISRPYTVARMTEVLLEAGVPESVLEVGTGSGYQTAVLAQLVDRVYSVERIDGLLTTARRRFYELQLRNIRLRHGDGNLGFPEAAPFDGIIVTAASEAPPEALLGQLKEGGRMVMPTGSPRDQVLVRITRTASGFEREVLEPASFVPLLEGFI